MRAARSIRAIASLAVPPRCVACTAATDPHDVLCKRCAAALAASRPGSSHLALGVPGPLEVRWASAYRGVARDLVQALKFGRHVAAAGVIAAALADRAPPAGAIVPVPASPGRRRWRGFDPAEEIALALAIETGLELHRCLSRRGGRRQVGRTRAERLADPPRVSLAADPPPSALIVDDVFTTGATLAACARALGESAAAAWVFAHSLGPGCKGA